MGGRGASSGGAKSENGFEMTYKSKNGFVMTEKSRIEQSKINKQEKQKYDKENEMCKDLADYGHNVIHLNDKNLSNGSYDIFLDGTKADLKRMKGTNNVYREGKSAIRDQGANLVVFKFDKYTVQTNREIKKTSGEWDSRILLSKRWRTIELFLNQGTFALCKGSRVVRPPLIGELS